LNPVFLLREYLQANQNRAGKSREAVTERINDNDQSSKINGCINNLKHALVNAASVSFTGFVANILD
jgi:hypothetical protein